MDLRRLLFLTAAGGDESGKEYTGNPVTFKAKSAKKLTGLEVSFTPTQSGTGNPSSQNVRPISGMTGCSIFHSGKDTSNPTEYAISWLSEGTVYGGTLDVVKGKLSVEWIKQTVTGESAIGAAALNIGLIGVTPSSGMFAYTDKMIPPEILCPDAVTIPNNSSFDPDVVGDMVTRVVANPGVFYIARSAWKNKTLDEVKALLTATPTDVVYKVATPQVVSLTAQDVVTLAGTNVIWSDANGDIKVTR